MQGTSVISGTATALVIATGDSTLVASMAATLASTKPPNAFDIGVRRVSYCLITFMVCMVPVVVALSGVSTGGCGAGKELIQQPCLQCDKSAVCVLIGPFSRQYVLWHGCSIGLWVCQALRVTLRAKEWNTDR